MVTHVTTATGREAAVLDEGDLSAAKTMFIKWMLGVLGAAMIGAGSLAAYTVKAEDRDTVLQSRVDTNSAVIQRTMAVHVDLVREVDSTRIELRHIADALDKIDRKIDRINR